MYRFRVDGKIPPQSSDLVKVKTQDIQHVFLSAIISLINHVDGATHVFRLARNHAFDTLLIARQNRILKQALYKQRFQMREPAVCKGVFFCYD